ncbi:hypothetical protein V8G54_015139 [Vigna mungo]|uniref:Uncharacterized protein n=1 Tax=Vigna mungo TaxID=3915 RepID=A0AAQ3S050_VIGMU
MAEALLGIVIQNLQSFGQDQLATFWGVDQHTQKLSSNLTAIRAVLRDAERKQITSHAVKDWLQKLRDAAYVLDDILDECSIHFTKMHSDDGHTSCLSRLHPNDILFRFNIGKRMKDITQRFHEIYEERSMFNLVPGVTEVQTIHDNWRQTSSDITEPVVYGRDQDREQIVKFLLEDASNSEELSIFPIVGMGGHGKTTLAKQVFNDNRVCKHFDLTIWVCVSDDFNTMPILQSIIECITGQNPNLNSLEALRKKVEEVLHGSRYLLVLDDVWNEDPEKWKQLKGKLQCARAAKGATILVTTRLEEVASTMQTNPAYHLKELSGDDSWSLFKHHAFGPNREETEELVSIGKEIVTKCVGSPLAIKTLGSLLRDESDVKQWQNVKESEIWDIREESSSATGEENSIMRALKLSYFNLELSLRRCFSFCAIFPKDFEIDKEELIHLWMANGFIKCEGNVEVEDVGNKVWKKLYSRSFFQEAKYDEFGMITTFKIHDLFHDLAQSIMGEECVVIVKERLTPLPTRVHYSSLLNFGVSGSMTAFKQRMTTALKKVESLQTFLDFGGIGPVPSSHCLRALRTSSSLLSPLRDLTHLRYLSLRFSMSWEESLNNSICQMPKLQILKLFRCHELHGLPKDLTRLMDLRHIVIDGMDTIQEMPPNIGKLRHLRTLSIFVVGSKPGCGLAELHSLNLGGTLRIRGLENVPNEWDAKEANLIGKKELNILRLSWDGNGNPKGSNVSVERVLEALEPPSTLKSFEMNGYQGRQFSSWMRNSGVLRDLVEVKLLGCENCEELPPLGKLPHLKRLKVSGMKNVKWIDGETYDGVEEKAFPSLEELSVYNLPKLERLLRDEGVEMVPHLSKLTIDGVLNFKVPRLPCVETLYARGIEAVTSFMEVVGNMACLKTLDIYCIKGVVVLPDEFRRLGALQELYIEEWYDVEYFPEHVLEGLTSLRTLDIYECKKLKSLSEGVGHLACLESLRISKCPELVALPSNMSQLSALRNVLIQYCCAAILDGLQRVPSLRVLDIECCTCTSLPDWLGDMNTLEELSIWDCKELRSLPSSIQRLTNLSYLTIFECPHLKKRCKRETGKDWQYINHIPKLFVYGYDDVLFNSPRNVLDIFDCTCTSLPDWLGDMTTLEELSIWYCKELRSLSSSIQRLTHLSYLRIEGCPDLKKRCKRETGEDWQYINHIPIVETLPKISKLRHLRTLSIFVVGSKPGCGLAELHSLNLGGSLRIRGLENVPNEGDAKQANLMSKKELNRLHLSWGSSANSEGSNVSVERVLEALEPPSALKSFGMRGYQGRQLSNWMKSVLVMRDLVEVELLDCDNCEELPPLGKLAHLKRLKVSGMKNVKWIDGETYDGVEEKAFPSLEKLTVRNLPNLERMLREEGVEMLPRLSQLTIYGVFNFKVPRLPCVEKLRAERIGEAASFMEVVGNMACVKTLSIEEWHDVEHFLEHVMEGLTSLRTLSIQYCEKLKSLSEGVGHLACLESLRISKCPKLVALTSNMSQLTALREVSIMYCCTLPYGLQRVPSLRLLCIYECTSTSLPDWLGDMISLQQLRIVCCKELRSLPNMSSSEEAMQ